MSIETIQRPVETPPEPARPMFGALAAGAFFLVGGSLWLLDALDVVEVRFTLILPVMLAVLGVVLMIGSMYGPQVGLIIAGVFLALAALVAVVTPPDAFHGGIGERRYVVTEQSQLQPRYDVGVGSIRLDISDLVLTESTDLTISVGAGEMVVILPDNLAVDIDASVGAGEIDIFGVMEAAGISREATYTSPGFDTAAITLRLRLSVAAGNIEVRR